jgi:putative chitinase
MTQLTEEILRQLAPRARSNVIKGILEYSHLIDEGEITPGPRRQMFLAQLAHESDGFRTTREYATGEAYEGREDLGNTEDGDGMRYRGRGLIQLTGRANYREFSDHLGVDIEEQPDLVEQFPLALQVSILFWNKRKLSLLADAGNFERITRRINGGLNGYADRRTYLERAESLDL